MRSLTYAILLTAAAILLGCVMAGCSTAIPADHLADCTVPVTRNAGMGVRVESCAAWQFGTIRESRAGAFVYRLHH